MGETFFQKLASYLTKLSEVQVPTEAHTHSRFNTVTISTKYLKAFKVSTRGQLSYNEVDSTLRVFVCTAVTIFVIDLENRLTDFSTTDTGSSKILYSLKSILNVTVHISSTLTGMVAQKSGDVKL
jgi:hypothetical protein